MGLPELPGLLQIWGIVAFFLIAAVAYYLAYRWHRARPGRPALHLDVLAVALLGLLTGGFFWQVFAERDIYMPAGGGDLASFYFPTYTYVAQQISNHTIPLWNPHLFSGMPLAADVQSALFYPLNLLMFLFVRVDYPQLEWFLILHYWLAATFTYLFLRDIGIGRLGALAGGVAFGFCGFMTAHFGHLPMIPVATWIPLVLLALRRAVLTRGLAGWAWAIAGGLFMAMSLLAGHIQIFAYGLMAAGLLWIYLLLGEERLTPRAVRPWVLKGGLVLLIALGIGAIQLLPSFQLSSQSVRASISYGEASAFSNRPLTMLNLFLPRIFGGNPLAYSPGEWQSTENWGYCGVVTIALAAAGVVLRRSRMVGFFALLVALSLVVMVGDLTIVGGWLYKFVPGFSTLRSSGRSLVLLGFGLAGLAAYGLDTLTVALSRRERLRGPAFWWLVGLSGVLVVILLGVMPALYSNLLANVSAPYSKLPQAINDVGMLFIWLAMLAGVGWAAYRNRLEARLASGLMVLLLVLDIFSPNSLFNPTSDNILAGFQHFDARGLILKYAQDKQTAIPYRVNSDNDAQDVWQPSTAMLASATGDLKMYEAGGAWNPLKLDRYDYYWSIAKQNEDTPLYDLVGAAFEVVSSTTHPHLNQPKWEQVWNDPSFSIYQDKNSLPRAFLVHDARIEPDRAREIDLLRTFQVDPRHTVLLESGTPVQSTQPGTAEQTGNKEGAEFVRATRYTDSPNAVDITVKANSPGWLVLTDAWYPGWEATVDGKSVPVEPAYYAFRAVKVDTGQHTVSMQFRPATWVWGRLITLLTVAGAVVGLIVLLVLLGRRRRVASRQ